MAQEYVAKTFKSGNSVALRLPKGLGVKAGLEMRVREEQGGFNVTPAGAPRPRIKGSWIGSMPGLRPLQPEDRMFEERDLDWTGAKLKRNE